MIRSLQRQKFFIRLMSWEYWPFNLVYIPVFLYYGWLALRARHLLFFSAANPGIPAGGLVGESKSDILDKIPHQWKPKGLLIPAHCSHEDCLRQLQSAALPFPLIAKPDIGERGLLVELISDSLALKTWRELHPVDVLIQEYIAYPNEVSVLHFRFPGQQTGRISSITLKKYLSVQGNGRDTLGQLIRDYPRARLQEDKLRLSHAQRWNDVPAKGEEIVFHTIGNHSKGCMFLDGRHLNSEQLLQTFDQINSHLDGIFYGRYDIKCASFEALTQGRDFYILEFNGVKSEPAHIYQPGYPILRFYRDILWHWKVIWHISRENHRRGVAYMSHRVGLGRLKALLQYHKRANARAVSAKASSPALALALMAMLFACSPQTVRQGRAEGPLREGLRHGKWTSYHFNGNVEWQGKYRMGKEQGSWKSWYEDGSLHEEREFRDAQLEGSYKAYYQSGGLKQEGEYRSGKKEGLWVLYHPDASKAERGAYRDDLPDGPFQSWYEGGQTRSQSTWSMGEGKGAFYYPNGALEHSAQWRKGKPHGVWEYYDRSGNIIRKEVYREGLLISSN